MVAVPVQYAAAKSLKLPDRFALWWWSHSVHPTRLRVQSGLVDGHPPLKRAGLYHQMMQNPVHQNYFHS